MLGRNKFFELCGRYSLEIYVIHCFITAGNRVILPKLGITYFALALISFITPMTKENLSDSINKSYIGSSMYNNNLLLKIIF